MQNTHRRFKLTLKWKSKYTQLQQYTQSKDIDSYIIHILSNNIDPFTILYDYCNGIRYYENNALNITKSNSIDDIKTIRDNYSKLLDELIIVVAACNIDDNTSDAIWNIIILDNNEIDFKCDLNEYGGILLNIAAILLRNKVIEYLIKLNVNINNTHALKISVDLYNYDALELLINAGVNITDEIFHDIVRTSIYGKDIIELIIDRKIKIPLSAFKSINNIKTFKLLIGYIGYVPAECSYAMQSSIMFGNTRVVKEYLDLGVNVIYDNLVNAIKSLEYLMFRLLSKYKITFEQHPLILLYKRLEEIKVEFDPLPMIKEILLYTRNANELKDEYRIKLYDECDFSFLIRLAILNDSSVKYILNGKYEKFYDVADFSINMFDNICKDVRNIILDYLF